MKKSIFSFAFPGFMLLGIVLSAWVIVTSLNIFGATAPRTAAPSVAQVATNTSEQVARGKQLFMAKGCIVCHINSHVQDLLNASTHDFDSISEGPNLSNLQADSDFLRRWLKDPKAVKPNTLMPNLNLTADEIDALVAFLIAKP
jgi:cytochrome c1